MSMTTSTSSRSAISGRGNRYNMDSNAPSMVQRTGDTLVVRSVVSGATLHIPGFEEPPTTPEQDDEEEEDFDDDDVSSPDNLPQCKIKRNYTCTHCSFFTQNPRTYLYHLKDEHKEKIRVYECPECVYASKHSQKLQRHIHMVHVVGRQKEELAKKSPSLTTKYPPPPPLTRADTASTSRAEEAGEDTDEDGLVVSLEGEEAAEELEEMDDGEEEGAEEEEEDEMMLDTSAHNSSVELEPEPGTSTEEIKCSICPFTSHSRTLVHRHENIAHLKKKFFRCTKCNYVTHMKARFTKHVKYHSMPMIKCDLCDFRTPYKWNLDRHYKNHQGDGEFKCPSCNFTADIKQSLTVHVQNHHLTPQQRLMRGIGRRNKVGASDAPAKELRMSDVGLVGAAGMPPPQRSSPPSQPPVLVLADQEHEISDDDDAMGEEELFQNPTRRQARIKVTSKKAAAKGSSMQEQNERHNFETDFIHPDDVLHKNGKVYYKNLKCNYCSYRAFWEGDILRHESKMHGINNPRSVKPKKRLARPIPNLIPLQQQTSTSPPAILRIPSVSGNMRSPPATAPVTETPVMSEQDINEICAKSSNSALKDFASLIGEAFPGDEMQDIAPARSVATERAVEVKDKPEQEAKQESSDVGKVTDDKDTKKAITSPEKESPVVAPPQVSTTKRKGTSSFFDKLQEKLIGQEASNLVCEHCGYESKCLSEALCHQKIHKDEEHESSTNSSKRSKAMVGVSSTRCQHCRHRCKTSADLLVHLQSCLSKDSTSDGHEGEEEESVPAEKQEEQKEEQEPPQCPNCEQRFDTEEDLSKHLDYCKPRLELNPEVSITEVRPQELHPMENKVFVWNQFTTNPSPEEMKPTLTIERIPSAPRPPQPVATESKPVDTLGDEDDEEYDYEGEGTCLVGFETAPGFGSVTNQKGTSLLKPSEVSHIQKVYKCPKCNFWASAASRFHIHLVGHLNRKPFGCSQCDYRSNWRWDVAKHIRLKGVRDPVHASESRPRVLVHDDDSSRRNYSKYNKFLTLMTVRLGQTQSDSPPPATTLPAPPRLIPAPTVPSIESGSPRSQPLRPPPPLRAATQHVLSQLANAEDKRGIKRPLQFGDGTSQGPLDANKPPESGTKRLLWRCKKCNYRGINKDEVLAHVRTHYTTTAAGVVQINLVPQTTKPEGLQPENNTPHSALNCDKCPFVARWQGELYLHQQHHVPQAGAIFKCYLCPFYVATKGELLSHMRIHGVNEPEEYLSRAMQARVTAAAAASKQTQDTEEDHWYGNSSADAAHSRSKRYKCGSCPYETNAKSQFTYHSQLHGGSHSYGTWSCSRNFSTDAILDGPPPFRCPVCSYIVAKRHLLHQHLRVHGIVVPSSRAINPHVSSSSAAAAPLPPSLDASRMKDVPLVWVMKGCKYHKMFKCRFCPHVNLRKVNIQEHEKMHKSRKSGYSVQSVLSDPSGMIHRCPQCTYQCNNAGVLSAHAKVHLDGYPRSCALVDLNRSDDAQLKDLGGEMAESSAELDDSELEQPMESTSSSVGHAGSPEVITITPQLSITPAAGSNHTNGMLQDEEQEEEEEEDTRLLFFCRQCPARFLFSRELAIHRRFHRIRLQHHCPSCNYTARQPSHLQAHAKVHTQEYQDRTQLLLQQHQMSLEHYKPSTVQRDGVWIVVEDSTSQNNASPGSGSSSVLQKVYACNRCPAKFFKSIGLSYHLTLHGGPGPYKCRSCDYSVKMYGNLVRHEPVHGQDIKAKVSEEHRPVRAAMSMANPMDFVPLSGTDLYNHREAQKMGGHHSEFSDLDFKPPTQHAQQPQQPLTVDPVFGTLMHGNPQFIYPTYFKNGKMKEKRYKCHKCPSAFEKREQYKVHLSLHGSKQKYRCERCDYSVKYYANFIQHNRKHEFNDEAKQAAADEAMGDEESRVAAAADGEETGTLSMMPSSRTAGKSISQPFGAKHGMIPMAERQHLMLQQRRKMASEETNKEEQISIVPSYWCPHCPYNSMRRDGVETHSKRHLCNNPKFKTPYLCQHCDYCAPQNYFLKEHNKLHFRWKPQPPGRRPETYMLCDEAELWSRVWIGGKENEEEIDTRKMVFQDKGSDVGDINDRFYPKLSSDEENDDDEDCEGDVYIDLRNGEIVADESVRLRTSTKKIVPPADTSVPHPVEATTVEQQQADEVSDVASNSSESN